MTTWLPTVLASCALLVVGCATAEPQREAVPAPQIVEQPGPSTGPVAEHSHDIPEEGDLPILDGILETFQSVPVLDKDGNPVLNDDGSALFEVRSVLEIFVKDHRRPYKEGERIKDTNFEIVRIWKDKEEDRIRSGVELRRLPELPPGYMPPAKPQPK